MRRGERLHACERVAELLEPTHPRTRHLERLLDRSPLLRFELELASRRLERLLEPARRRVRPPRLLPRLMCFVVGLASLLERRAQV